MHLHIVKPKYHLCVCVCGGGGGGDGGRWREGAITAIVLGVLIVKILRYVFSVFLDGVFYVLHPEWRLEGRQKTVITVNTVNKNCLYVLSLHSPFSGKIVYFTQIIMKSVSAFTFGDEMSVDGLKLIHIIGKKHEEHNFKNYNSLHEIIGLSAFLVSGRTMQSKRKRDNE